MEFHMFTKGSCLTMCPKKEMQMREREKLLHRLEMLNGTENDKIPKADSNKTVKCFSRSAADVNMAVPHLIRPFSVLKHTLEYLISEVLKSKKVSDVSVYNFVWDRLRSVRQDMTIQALPPAECIQLLEPMVLFHALYGYKLCEKSRDEYDPVLNKKQLMECLKQLLVCYDSVHSDLADQMSRITVSDTKIGQHNLVETNRSLMESIYILVNINNIEPMIRYLNLPKYYRNGRARLSYNIAAEIVRGNVVRACRLAKQLSPVEMCCFCLHLPHLQRRILEVYSHAYNSKQLTVPATVLEECFLFNNIQEVESVCKHYGLKAFHGNLLFSKTDFIKDSKMLPPKEILFVDEPDICEIIGI